MSATTKKTAVPPAPTFVDACQAHFGAHPEDVLAPINSSAEALMQMYEIFKTIAADAIDGRDGYRIKHLADAGAHVAFDIADFAGYEHEKFRNSLIAAGVLKAEGDHE